MIFVVTRPEDGWNCVYGVYEADSKQQVYQSIADEQGDSVRNTEGTFIVHEPSEIKKLN